MKVLQKNVCVLGVMMIATASVWAATDSTDLTVTGTIVPVACTPTFTGGGVVDYGVIGSNSLEKTSYNLLSQKQLEFSITCDAAAKVGFKPVAGRVGSELVDSILHRNGWGITPAEVLLFEGSREIVSGLGFDGSGNKIGGVALKILQGASDLDGSESLFLHSPAGTLNGWQLAKDGDSLNQLNSPNAMYAWSETSGQYAPKAFINSTSTVRIHAFLNKAEELDLSQEVNLDGLVTFELFYF